MGSFLDLQGYRRENITLCHAVQILAEMKRRLDIAYEQTRDQATRVVAGGRGDDRN